MKTIFTSLAILLSIATSAQTIRRVNNNPGITGTNIYTTIQAAHDAAVNGDVIYVEPSLSKYGNLNCTKSLTIIGSGYFLTDRSVYDQNPAPTSVMDQITMRAGSEGSSLIGITTAPGDISILTSNITVSRCRVEGDIRVATFDGTAHRQISNIQIQQNWCYSGFFQRLRFPGSSTFVQLGAVTLTPSQNSGVNFLISNVSIRNNRIESVEWNEGLRSLTSSILVEHNHIGRAFEYPTNAVIQNNIIWDSQFFGISGGFINCTVSNNFSAKNILPSGNSNVNNVDLSALFIENASSLTEDKQAQLRASSIAKGAGTGGADLGIYGGATPYVPSGIPPYPVINKLISTGTGSNTTPLSVTISTSSRN